MILRKYNLDGVSAVTTRMSNKFSGKWIITAYNVADEFMEIAFTKCIALSENAVIEFLKYGLNKR